MDMRKTFKCGLNAKFSRIMVLFMPFVILEMYLTSSSEQSMDLIILLVGVSFFINTSLWFQHAVPLEIKTNEEGMTIRRWKKEKFYAWKDVKILLITKILFPLGRFDLHLLSEPFHKRYLMILGLNRKQRKELMQIVKQGIESYKGCS